MKKMVDFMNSMFANQPTSERRKHTFSRSSPCVWSIGYNHSYPCKTTHFIRGYPRFKIYHQSCKNRLWYLCLCRAYTERQFSIWTYSRSYQVHPGNRRGSLHEWSLWFVCENLCPKQWTSVHVDSNEVKTSRIVSVENYNIIQGRI